MLGDPALLAPSAVSIPEPQLREAVILDDATQPGQEVRCVVPTLDPSLATDPMPWMPRGEGELPRRGDRAIIGQPADGPPVILAWFPAPVVHHLYPGDDVFPDDELFPE